MLLKLNINKFLSPLKPKFLCVAGFEGNKVVQASMLGVMATRHRPQMLGVPIKSGLLCDWFIISSVPLTNSSNSCNQSPCLQIPNCKIKN